MHPSAPLGEEERSLGRSFPAINRRATVGMSLWDSAHINACGGQARVDLDRNLIASRYKQDEH